MDLSIATEEFPLGRCHRCGEPIADRDKGNEGCEDPHCPTLHLRPAASPGKRAE